VSTTELAASACLVNVCLRAIYSGTLIQAIDMPTSSRRPVKLDIRTSSEAKRILQKAGRTRIGLNSEQWTAFMTTLDAPPRTHERMTRLLKEPSVLD
jgi:uncharacterized protein (DUF1778 family)